MWDWNENISAGIVRLMSVLALIGAPFAAVGVFLTVSGLAAFVWSVGVFLYLIGAWAVLNTVACISVRLRKGTIGEDAPRPQPVLPQPQPYEQRPPVIR